MPQTMYVKVLGGPGKTATVKEVHILRSWQEADGRQVYLHSNGVYGYKDGSLVRSVSDLDIIGDPIQHRIALSWWERTGKNLSKGFYDRQAEEVEKRQMEVLPPIVEGESALDAILYTRRPAADKSTKAIGEPSTWPEFGFPKRPEWWGQAEMIKLGAYVYELEDLSAGEENIEACVEISDSVEATVTKAGKPDAKDPKGGF